MNKTVCWISGGVSSFVAAYLMKPQIDDFIYIHIDNQHEDTLRFVKDCERALNKPIVILQSPYKNVENVLRVFKWINSPIQGAKCTQVLKKRVRQEWELDHKDYKITYVWGFDAEENERANRLIEYMPQFNHAFPLIKMKLSKADAHGILQQLNIRRPVMYNMGYNNNNCIGCVKGGMGYWNKIRNDFPQAFETIAKVEREIGASCINGTFLDELDPNRGHSVKDIPMECGILCEMLASHNL